MLSSKNRARYYEKYYNLGQSYSQFDNRQMARERRVVRGVILLIVVAVISIIGTILFKG